MDIGADHKIKVWAMIETPTAILNVRDIAAVANDIETRLSCLVIGTNDLAKEMRARIVPGRAPVLPLLIVAIAAARAHGIDILDGPFNDLGNAEGFANECAQARDIGFDGKTIIHPNQIAPCNAAFTPNSEEIAQARAIIAAFEMPENKGKGVIALDGRMVERMHAEMARRSVAIADAVAERGM
jgi:citrate lyase subunit beta/citryl-CoA lyase